MLSTQEGTVLLRGFTLVELSIVMIILSLLIGAGVSSYDSYVRKKRVEDNVRAVMSMQRAVDKYFMINRRYPCPAPLSLGPGDVGYGASMDCSDTTAGDYGLVERTNFDHDQDAGTPTVNLRIRTGTFPFLELTNFLIDNTKSGFVRSAARLGSHDVLDAYGRQFTYVVTERQATDDYADNFGAIKLSDAQGNLVANNTNFLLISHGENGIGARLPSGNIYGACTGTGKDIENCDGDFDYIRDLQYHAPGTTYYDDAVAYMRWMPFFLWGQSDTNPDNIYNLNAGNVGIGLRDPQEQLHIKDGDMLSYYSIDDAGEVVAQNICASDGSDCFPAELIGGDIFTECTKVDEMMAGIANNVPTCVSAFTGNFTESCPVDKYISGMAYSTISKTLTVTCTDPTFGR